MSLLFVALIYGPESAASATATAVAAASTAPALFETERAAQAHCPNDTAVWLDTRTGIRHEKGTRCFGRTGAGAAMKPEAAGDRDTRNGR